MQQFSQSVSDLLFDVEALGRYIRPRLSEYAQTTQDKVDHHTYPSGKQLSKLSLPTTSLGWEIHSKFRGIPQLIRFWTFWTPEFSSEFYFSDRKMCSRQFWTHFFQFGILSHHLFFWFHESKNVPAISIFLAHHENIQSYILAGIPKDT
jgi:hypothetical protein